MNTRIPQKMIVLLIFAFGLVSTSFAQGTQHLPSPAEQSYQGMNAPGATHLGPKYYKPIPNKRSPYLAAGLTLGTYFGGFALAYIGGEENVDTLVAVGGVAFLAAPAIGHIYAGESVKGLKLAGLNTLGFGLLAAGAANGCLLETDCTAERSLGSLLLMASGMALHVGSLAYSVYDSPRAAIRTNEKQRRMMLAPTMVGKNLGLGVVGSF